MDRQIWTVSNGLSFLRALLVAPIAIILLQDNPDNRLLIIVLIIIAGFTDLLDGYAARKMNQVTELGKIIDPIADKIAVVVVTIILAQQGKVPLWFLAVAFLRDVLIFTGGMYLKRTRNLTLQSNLTGKWTVTVVSVYIIVAIVNDPSIAMIKELLMAAAMIMLVISFMLYLKRFAEILK